MSSVVAGREEVFSGNRELVIKKEKRSNIGEGVHWEEVLSGEALSGREVLSERRVGSERDGIRLDVIGKRGVIGKRDGIRER